MTPKLARNLSLVAFVALFQPCRNLLVLLGSLFALFFHIPAPHARLLQHLLLTYDPAAYNCASLLINLVLPLILSILLYRWLRRRDFAQACADCATRKIRLGILFLLFALLSVFQLNMSLVYPAFPTSVLWPDAPIDPGEREVFHYIHKLGVGFCHSADFAVVRFALPEIPETTEESLKALGIDRSPQVGLVEKRFLVEFDLHTDDVPMGEVPAIVMERYPAFPATDTEEGGLLETCAASVPVQHIGEFDAYELPCYPGPCGEAAFCWLVSIPDGWLVIHAPRFFEPAADDAPDAAPRPTGYDLEIRRILESLGINNDWTAPPPGSPASQTAPSDISDEVEIINREDIPVDLPACMAKLDAMLSEKDKAYIRENDPIHLHFSLGMWIRNEWGLWCDEEGIIPLVDYFWAHGIQHPDDMSGTILDCYAWHLRGEEVDYEAVLRSRAEDLDRPLESPETTAAPDHDASRPSP